MNAAASPVHWAQIGESTCVIGMRLLAFVHRAFGRTPFRLCLYPVVLYYWATKRTARLASIDYLRRLHARMQKGQPGNQQPGARDSLRHFLSFAETLLDKTLAWSGRYPFERVRLRGAEPLLQMIERREGALLVTAHIGCLELCQALALRCPGLKLTVLVHTAHAQRFNRLLDQLNPDNGVRLLQVADISAASAVLLADCIARGEFVAIAGDRVPLAPDERNTVVAPFLGHPAAFPIGPYVLASLLKCPLYLMACVRSGNGHEVVFDRLAEHVMLPRATRRAAMAELAGAFSLRLETLLARAPYEWFNFYPYWEPVA